MQTAAASVSRARPYSRHLDEPTDRPRVDYAGATEARSSIDETAGLWHTFSNSRAWYLRTMLDEERAKRAPSGVLVQTLAANIADLEGQRRTVSAALARARQATATDVAPLAAVARSLVLDCVRLAPDWRSQNALMEARTKTYDRDRFL